MTCKHFKIDTAMPSEVKTHIYIYIYGRISDNVSVNDFSPPKQIDQRKNKNSVWLFILNIFGCRHFCAFMKSAKLILLNKKQTKHKQTKNRPYFTEMLQSR